MSGLTAFQDAFTAALGGDGAALAPWLAEPEPPGLSVYRNTTAKGAVDALAATYPTVERLVGEDWFAAAASLYARAHRPSHASLLDYGAGFPDWLAAFGPARDMPYLAGVARIDGLWIAAHFAADAGLLQPGALFGLGAEAFEQIRGVLHPAARLAWFDGDIPSLWIANRPPAPAPDSFEMTDRAEGMLVTRPGLTVQTQVVDAPAFAFLDACARGLSLAEAAAAALETDPGADLLAILDLSLEAGAVAALEPIR